MCMDYHKTVRTITSLLSQNGCWFEIFEHKEVRTSEEAAKVRTGYSLNQGAKAIIIREKLTGGEKKFVMLVMPADKRFDNEKTKSCLNSKDIRFATPEEISSLTEGILPGGVPPFGNLFNLEVIADPTLFDNEKIIFNAGDRRFSIAMKSVDYRKIVNPKIISII